MSLMSAPDRLSQRNRAGSTSGAVSGMGKAPGWQHRACGGSSQQLQGWGKMVGAAGFEPTTLCPPDKCATRLRYAPTARRHRQTGLLRQASNWAIVNNEGFSRWCAALETKNPNKSDPRLCGDRPASGAFIADRGGNAPDQSHQQEVVPPVIGVDNRRFSHQHGEGGDQGYHDQPEAGGSPEGRHAAP